MRPEERGKGWRCVVPPAPAVTDNKNRTIGPGRADGRGRRAEDSIVVPAGARNGSALFGVTARELEVWILIAEGMSNKQIALRLRISPLTVRNHVTNLYNKLQVRHRMAAAMTAYRSGLLDQVTSNK